MHVVYRNQSLGHTLYCFPWEGEQRGGRGKIISAQTRTRPCQGQQKKNNFLRVGYNDLYYVLSTPPFLVLFYLFLIHSFSFSSTIDSTAIISLLHPNPPWPTGSFWSYKKWMMMMFCVVQKNKNKEGPRENGFQIIKTSCPPSPPTKINWKNQARI